MATASALQPDLHLLLLAGAAGRHRTLLRALPPRAPLVRRGRRPGRGRGRAVRVVSSGDGAGLGGFASAVEVDARPVLGPVGVEEQGAWGGGEGDAEEAAAGVALGPRWPSWEGLPERYKLIGATSLAFAICNMDKVNLSVAIIPMAHQYGWNSSTAGLVQSSFFWGFALSQLPGGWLAKQFGGRYIPLEERSRAVSVVYDGSSFGSVLGLLFAPPIIQNLGWESSFYILGLLGIVWCLGFESLKEQQLGDNEGTLNLGPSSSGSDGLISSAVSSKSSNLSLEDTQNSLKQSLLMISPQLFSYSEELNLSLTEAAWVSVLPPLCSMVVTSIVAPFADNLISNGVDTTKVRKICQTISFVSPAVFLMLSSVDLGVPPWGIVAFLTTGLALSNFALSGLYCTHQDISREYASILLGITTTAGSVPGIVGISLTGYLLDSTHSWSISLFAPAIFFYLTGTAVWLAFASSEPQDFGKSERES
ncbi:putative anion transporter 5, chloroplastic [Panicum miliaceum]|uniref:Anion transporter 5, chloroplastic n=1 Tax=Panicum miliaceum TaxID=4540 RepID=A0A3L6RVV5_PANMI|nr:putative anion transporter 5, chloroplastic [Panicum miliaceum]